MSTVLKNALDDLTAAFERAGIDDARADARLLVAFALNKQPVFVRMHSDSEIEDDAAEKIEAFKRRRLNREPVSKIIGTRGFWRLDFKVTQDVLDPRPDSETLIEEILKRKTDKTAALKILDLGTGSGCLALSLLSEYLNASAIGADSSEKALQIARENAESNGLSARFKTVQADWNKSGWSDTFGTFDIVISNPPYIGDDEPLDPEVALFDPKQALFAGADGLDAYRALFPVLGGLLAENGLAVFEFGKGQHEAVKALAEQNGLAFDGFGTDLGGIVRCIALKKQKPLENGQTTR